MGQQYGVINLIQQIVRDETKYLRHYVARVFSNADPENKGAIQVLCDELGWDSPKSGPWIYPRDLNKLSLPGIGDYVEIYFMGGDLSRPVYIGKCNELFMQLPRAFSGLPTNHVLFESPLMKKADTFDDAIGKRVIDYVTMELGMGSTEAMVLGTTLKTELQKIVDQLTQLKTDLDTWSPVANDGGAALKTLVSTGFLTKPLASLTNILSLVTKVK